ncbi:MAG: WD40 repeat domain-containing protein [archaeon]|nr:WD40 repeat domain-containing protein [archaeon]
MTDKKEINYREEIEMLNYKLKNYDRDINLSNFFASTNTGSSYDSMHNKFKNLSFDLQGTIIVPRDETQIVQKDNPKGNAPEDKEKFNDLQWAGENPLFSNQIITCTDKGRIIIFNTDTKEVIYQKQIGTGMLNACAVEQTDNQMFAAGGFDGTIFVQNIKISKNKGAADADDYQKKFIGHFGGISTIRFLNTSYMLSASYDSMIILWDINSQGKIVNSFREHTSEVSGLDVCDTNGNIFASGSGDTTAKLWDLREKKACVGTFQGCDSSINCVKFVPGRISTIAAGSEDSTIRLFDYRAFKEIGCFKRQDNNSINSVFFSKSGCMLFATVTDKQSIFCWDLFGSNPETPIREFGFTGDDGESSSKRKGNSKDADATIGQGGVGFTKGGIDSKGRKIAVIQGGGINIFK